MKKKILLVISTLFGLIFINSGLNKFFNYMPMPENMPENMMKLMNAFLEIGWLMPLVAIAEIPEEYFSPFLNTGRWVL